MSLLPQAKQGFFWSSLIQFSFQIIGFFVTVVLARLMSPAEFGLVGIVSIFVSLGKILLDGGLASSLIRNKLLSDVDYSTVFLMNVGASIVLFIALFVAAPAIALFFNEPAINWILRVYSIVFPLGALSIVQSVRLNKDLNFKTQFKLLLPSLILSALVSVVMALCGLGVWSLVAKDVVFTVAASLQLWFYSDWRPKFAFSRDRFVYHFRFGYRILLTQLLNGVANNSYNMLIGKFVSASQLGLFTRAKSLEELPNGVIYSALNRVLFPLLAQVGDDDSRLKSVYRRIISVVAFVLVPVLSVMGYLATPIFILLFTDKWSEAVPYFQILIFAALSSPFQSYLLNICKVKGRSDLILRLTILEYILIGLGLVSFFWFGFIGILWSIVFVSFAKFVVTAIYAGGLIGYRLSEQISDVYRPYLFSLLAIGVLVFANNTIEDLETGELGFIVVSVFIFGSVFIALSVLTKNKVLADGVALLLSGVKRRAESSTKIND